MVLLGLVPLAVYLAAYIGRMPGEVIGLPWEEGTFWRGIWDHQQAMLTFHTSLEGSHPYESPPWSWLLLKRPVAYFFEGDFAANYREILAIGSPLAWLLGALGVLALAVAWARRGWEVRGPEAVLIVAALATILPWLVLQGSRSQVFLWYLLPTVPFMYAALGVLAGMGLAIGPGEGGRRPAGRRRHRPVRLLLPDPDRPAATASETGAPASG